MLNIKRTLQVLIAICLSAMAMNSFAEVKYCPGANSTFNEDIALQKAIKVFEIKMGCSAGENCIMKKPSGIGTSRFVISWVTACGPIQNGVRTLMFGGTSTTFICNEVNTNLGKQICCSPLGSEMDKSLNQCANI